MKRMSSPVSSDLHLNCPILLPLEEVAVGETAYGELSLRLVDFIEKLYEHGVPEFLIPDDAQRAELCLTYMRRVESSGHESGYFGVETHIPDEQSIVLDTLNEIDPPVYHVIFAAALRWSDGDAAVNIEHLDTLFSEVQEQQPLSHAVGAWLLTRPNVRGVPYSELPEEISRLAKQLMTASPENGVIDAP